MDLFEAFPQLKKRQQLKAELMKLKKNIQQEKNYNSAEFLDAQTDDDDDEHELDENPKKISISRRQHPPSKKRGIYGLNDLPQESFFDFLFGRSAKKEHTNGAGRRLKDGAYVQDSDMYETVLHIVPLLILFFLFFNFLLVWKLHKRVNCLNAELARSRVSQPSYIMWPPNLPPNLMHTQDFQPTSQ